MNNFVYNPTTNRFIYWIANFFTQVLTSIDSLIIFLPEANLWIVLGKTEKESEDKSVLVSVA